MGHTGIDVHKNASRVCIRTETGHLIERRVRTDRESFANWLGKRDRARILIESSPESEWVAQCLEDREHQVIVADPDFAPMYAQRSRKQSEDRPTLKPFVKPARSARIGRHIGAPKRAVRFEPRRRYAKRWCKRALGTSV